MVQLYWVIWLNFSQDINASMLPLHCMSGFLQKYFYKSKEIHAKKKKKKSPQIPTDNTIALLKKNQLILLVIKK